jgi:hypothetical protein
VSSQSAFRVVRVTERVEWTPKTIRTEEVLAETDDWVEAELAYKAGYERQPRDVRVTIEGEHPSHSFQPDTRPGVRSALACSSCGAPKNGCFKSHAPCGYETSGPIIAILEREAAARG